MRVSFQSPQYCFEADFNMSETARAVTESLPLDSTIDIAKDRIYFKAAVKTSVGQVSNTANIGDIAYFPKDESICVFFSPVTLAADNSVIIIGKTEINPVEIGHMKSGDPIRVMSISPAEAKQAPLMMKESDFPQSRKLTQSEIDALVQLILAKKKKGN